MQNSIGKLNRLPLREVWPHEALDFTIWLQNNIEIINESIGINLSSIEREQAAGDFKVDIIAEDESGEPVVIENQLEKSDHDHLGKLITYLTAFEARTAIWIVSEPRPEHITAITWLNESTPEAFYLVKVEAVQIDDSSPAPLLTTIVGPSEEGRQIGQKKKEWAEREKLRYRFWEKLLERSNQKTSLFNNISPSHHTWINAGSGVSGLPYGYVVRKNDCHVELYIDRGKGNEDENQKVFDHFFSKRDQIELEFGDSIDWERLEGRRASRIAKYMNIGGYRNPEEEWSDIQDTMVEAMIKLEKALGPFIRKLNL